jgi:CRISPR-associated protein Cmr2
MPSEFDKAVAYCLAYDRWNGKTAQALLTWKRAEELAQTDEQQIFTKMLEAAGTALQEPPDQLEEHVKHLERVNSVAQSLGDSPIALLMGGATKIKGYVFESAKLPEIRGASALLDRINRIDLPALFSHLSDGYSPSETERAESVRDQFRERHHGKEPLDCRDCVIYANGGEILAFAPNKIASALADEIEFLYNSETLIANSVAVWRSCSLVELSFGVRPLDLFPDRFKQINDDRLRKLLRNYYEELDAEHYFRRKTFGELASAVALEKLRRRDGNEVCGRPPKSIPHLETNPYARRCTSCERRAAVAMRPFDTEERWLCEPCARKSVFGQETKKESSEQTKWFKDAGLVWEAQGTKAWATHFDEWLGVDANAELKKTYYGSLPQAPASGPEDLEDIAEAATPSGFIGAIYADGNNMGALLEELETPSEYATFAKKVNEATTNATFTALAKHLKPVKGKHRFEVLSIGGDDVFLIVPAHAALRIAVTIAREVEEELRQEDITRVGGGYAWAEVHRIKPQNQPSSLSKVVLSSGVLIADQHTPVFLIRRLAEELLKSAKARAKKLRELDKQYYGATVDFMSLKSLGMIVTRIEDFRDQALRRKDLDFTAKPYTIPEVEALLTAVEELKKADFPKSQLYHLREQVEKGWLASIVDYLYFLCRSPHAEELREVLGRWVGSSSTGRVSAIGPWVRRDGQGWETVLGDLLEIYDFVPEET